MRRSKYVLVLLLTIFCAALLIAPSRSRAITYGFIDSNNTYSNTGAFIVKSPTTGQIFPTPRPMFETVSTVYSYFESARLANR